MKLQKRGCDITSSFHLRQRNTKFLEQARQEIPADEYRDIIEYQWYLS
jgi:hypothetical protein